MYPCLFQMILLINIHLMSGGVETRYVDESLLITKVLNDSIQKYLQVGDRVTNITTRLLIL